MTSKLLSEATKGKSNFASGLFDISKAAKKTGTAKGSTKDEESDPDILDQVRDDAFKGPPSFYEADVQKYMRKFDNSL